MMSLRETFYEVVVSTVGLVYCGTDEGEALRHYVLYVEQSKNGTGYAAGEVVAVIRDRESIMAVFDPKEQ